MMAPSITLIVAATLKWGIGKGGTLPWPVLKQEMAYFARVTKRAVSSPVHPATHAPKVMNAVIMGRKTWESIPSGSKPLKDRINVVISRTPESLRFPKKSDEEPSPLEGPFATASIPDALLLLDSICANETPGVGIQASWLGRVFIIGGAEIYSATLQLEVCDRILLTRVEGEWECDTFFPLKLEQNKAGGNSPEWRKQTAHELGDWIGEDLGDGTREENGISWQWELWTREIGGEFHG